MAQESKTLGQCPICKKVHRLTEQHVRLMPELEGFKVMICRSCHDTITSYEEYLKNLLPHVPREQRGRRARALRTTRPPRGPEPTPAPQEEEERVSSENPDAPS